MDRAVEAPDPAMLVATTAREMASMDRERFMAAAFRGAQGVCVLPAVAYDGHHT
ncbi:hypothetical protein GCM10027055_16250 [Janibacter alkaliphilus]